MPLGGAGITEALMTFSLHWTGQPVLPGAGVSDAIGKAPR